MDTFLKVYKEGLTNITLSSNVSDKKIELTFRNYDECLAARIALKDAAELLNVQFYELESSFFQKRSTLTFFKKRLKQQCLENAQKVEA